MGERITGFVIGTIPDADYVYVSVAKRWHHLHRDNYAGAWPPKPGTTVEFRVMPADKGARKPRAVEAKPLWP
jgi:hypothetical protein